MKEAKAPILSIVTVNLDNASGLERTIESVIAQTFADYEHIIIDGASSDGSEEIIRKYEDGIAWWCSEKDRGIYHAMNKGIKNSRGTYLQFLNSGDTFTSSEVLEKVFGIERSADIVYGDIYYVYPDGSKKRYKSLREDRLTMANFFHDTIAHPAAFIHRRLFANGLFDEELRIVADNKFFYERVIFQNCSVQSLDLVISDFDTTGISSQKENWKKTNEERDRVINELLPPRIRKDYETLFLFFDSPLLAYMPVLNQTTGFHKFVSLIVGCMVKVYCIFRFRKFYRNR